MISDALARSLRDAGLRWDPAPGDQFRIEATALSEEVFILSHMVIEPRTYETGTVLNFNGTTEWALDNIDQDDALWLPREDQLRDLLGGTFQRMERIESGYRVSTAEPDGRARDFTDVVAEDAYARALLHLVHEATD
ncbi:pilus assembly protein CpaE [Ruania halotolerans]|uniref:pilus assembly protein CpaE n=1 Tax=Ruania halotolerans TaxID=2897773 RepID=UPI001E5C0E0F|nr:pilus assembly protein CpaE [Ruania halotolerans]UFU07696.1 pilus assembly protein CpaE [Ruania halotolerans]